MTTTPTPPVYAWLTFADGSGLVVDAFYYCTLTEDDLSHLVDCELREFRRAEERS